MNVPTLQSGILLVNKPSGPTSYDMIRWIKRSLKTVKIGHCGTLDPLAEGLLIILLGKATKEQSKYMGADKTYLCRVRLGIRTDSGDITGKVLEVIHDFSFPEESRLRQCLQTFLGEQQQIPPMYSALKVDGTRLYTLAREGKTVERKPRPITIRSIDLVRTQHPNEFEFRVECSSGTYVRTLVEDLGHRLEIPAAMSGLVRESIGKFNVSDAVRGDELVNIGESGIWDKVNPVY